MEPPLDQSNDANGPLDLSNLGRSAGGGASVATAVAFDDTDLAAASLGSATNVQTAIDAVIAGMLAADSQLQSNIDSKAPLLPIGELSMSYWTDFLTGSNAASMDPFIAVLISSGTVNVPNISAADHPGMVRLRSSATIDSGVFIGSNTGQLLLAGGERYEVIFYINLLTSTTIRFGFLDTATVAAPTDGVYFEIASTGVAVGHIANNGSISDTVGNETLTTATWYRAIIDITQNPTQAQFQILSMDGTALFSENLNGSIPTGAGRETGVGFIATNGGGAAADICHVDYMGFAYLGTAPQRGF